MNSGGRAALALLFSVCMVAVAALGQSSGTVYEQDGWTLHSPDFSTAPKFLHEDRPLADQENGGGWKKLEAFSDEFNGNALDLDKWWPKNPTWEGRPPGRFEEENVSVSKGILCLAANALDTPKPGGPEGRNWQYATAAVQSRDKVLYGHFEVRAKVMAACICNAFWFYHATPERWTEIDVFEIGARAKGNERKAHMTVHVFHTPEDKTHRQWSQAPELPFDPAADFHVYSLDWTPEHIRYYVDGLLVREGENRHWHQPLTMNFDVEIMEQWFGMPAAGELPAVYEVDYVRAWTRGDKGTEPGEQP